MTNFKIRVFDLLWIALYFLGIPLYLFITLQEKLPNEAISPLFLSNIMLPIALNYLLGSIPFGLLLSKQFGAGDIRKSGSGNIGATNVLRTGGKFLGLMTLILDLAKGSLAAWIALSCTLTTSDICAVMPSYFPLIIGSYAVIGHIFPLWLQFRGGKGVATYLGVILIFSWPLLIIAAVAWLVTAFLSRFSSLASLIMIFSVPLFSYVFHASLASHNNFLVWVLLSFLICYKHHENIKRLYTGKESKIGQQK